MDCILGFMPVESKKATVCCRKRKNRGAIITLAVASVLLSWLVYGVTCAAIVKSLTLWQALFCPVVLALMALEAIGWFAVTLKKDARKYSRM